MFVVLYALNMSGRRAIALECHRPIELSLGDNKLKFTSAGWALDSSDIQIAAKEITELVQQNEQYYKTFDAMNAEIKLLQGNLEAANHIKRISLDMVLEEREKNMQLEKELALYKERLRESYAVIVQLKKE